MTKEVELTVEMSSARMMKEVKTADVVSPMSPLTDIEVKEDDEDEDTKKKRELERSLWTKIWQGLAAASIAVNIAAMVIWGGVATIVMGVIACVVGVIVIKRQMDLQDTDTLRRLQNMLRHEVNRLQQENNKLHESVNELETKVAALKESEEKLTAITAEQGTNVDKFVGLVKENQEILDEMKKAVKSDMLNDLFSIVVQCDVDQSYSISEQEVQMLALRMDVDPRVNFNKDLLREKMKEHGGSISVSDLVKEFASEVPEEEQFFIFNEEEITKQ